jgi:hypothetical protein
MSIKESNRRRQISEFQITEFQNIMTEGKKNDIVSLYLKNNKVNENYSLILEDKEMLDETKKIVCVKFYQDRIKEIGIQTRKYLEAKNIPESDIKLIEENLEYILIFEGERWDKFKNWASNTKVVKGIKKGANYVGSVISDTLGWLSDSAQSTWDSIVEDIFKPGLEALKNVATKLFGADIVAQIEATAKKVMNSIDDFVKTSKSVFDKVYATLKDLAKNLANIVKDIWTKIKEILGKVWEFIKTHALKIIPGLKSKLSIVKDFGDKINSEHLGNEMKILSEDIKDMKMYFGAKLKKLTGNSVEDIATSSGNKILGSVESTEEKTKEQEIVNDSFIWDSLKGFMSKNSNFNTDELVKLHETKFEKIYEAENSESEDEENVEKEIHKAESRGIKKWLIGIVSWILSPFGKLMEVLSDVVAKGLSAVPAWLSGKLGTMFDGVKNLIKYAGKFVAIGTITALVVGASAEAFALTTHIPGDWIKMAGEKIGLGGAVQKAEEFYAETGRGIERATGVNLKDMKPHKESRLIKFNDFNKVNESEAPKKGINWKGLAIGAGSALLAFLVSVFTHAIPGLHMAFEVISLVVLVIATLGWCFTETEWGKNFTKKNPVITSVSKLLFNFIHAH